MAKRSRWEGALVCAALLASAGTGCILRDLAKVRELEAVSEKYAYISGTARYESADASETSSPDEARWLVVYALTVPCDDDWTALKGLVDQQGSAEDPAGWARECEERVVRLRDELRLADHVVLQHSGFWYVRVAPGCYAVGAFV
jgi:hypothetical protein